MTGRGMTLWETVCSLAGNTGDDTFRLEEALNTAAAGPEIALVEIKQLLQQGMLEQTSTEGVLRLTQTGRLSCDEIHNTEAIISPQNSPADES